MARCLPWEVPLKHPHRVTLLALLQAIGLGLGLCGSAGADGILPAGARILDPEQILSTRTRRESTGDFSFRDGSGIDRRFIVSIADPSVRNRGDGAFHPASSSLVEEAIQGVDSRFTSTLHFETWILPYPASNPLGSWADAHAIYIAPGVYEITTGQIHFFMSHEIGHLVHRAILPDTDHDGWARYLSMRGIADTTRFNARAEHRNRPHEIFAEDFRMLFGSDDARKAGEIENSDLRDPREIPGLEAFFVEMLAKAGSSPAMATARVYPNPLSRGDLLRFALPTSLRAPDVRLYDVTGREVREIRGLTPTANGAAEILWDGLDDAGHRLPLGAYFGLIRDGNGGGDAVRFTLRLVR
jgi:hypothetical protein